MLAPSLTFSLLLLQASAPADKPVLETVEVRSAALQRQRGSIPGISQLDTTEIESVGPAHPSELFARVPGAWISRGSGQEQLTALRSPVLTGPGACGAFMVLEDHVPIRPAGFCNVNSLFEVNLLQSARVDIVRGPGSVIYGSNALHGVMDVISRRPGVQNGWSAGIEAGTDDYYRGRAGFSSDSFLVYGNYVNSGSFRDDEGFEHTLANAAWTGQWNPATVDLRFALADLDQDTAGFVQGKDAYKDPALRTTNPNPEAFRDADALRLTSRIAWGAPDGAIFEITPYARSSDMRFLQHFLPGKPKETNGQDSLGIQFNWRPFPAFAAGVDIEWADGDLVEFQENPTMGSPFLVETRPQGFHYDYSVRQWMAAAWAQYENNIDDNLILTMGLRGEFIEYDYTNHMLAGNTRDDGTACGFGGCLYSRPASRSDDFTRISPDLGLQWLMDAEYTLFARLARGYRPPQATELYRLQRGQAVADLDSETLDTLELGIRSVDESTAWDLTLFVMRKDHFIFRDANGFNVSDGKTDHHGAELSIDWRPYEHWWWGVNASWAHHEYAFDRPASGIVSGNEVDTAPEWLASARIGYDDGERVAAELEWVYMGDYFLDPANQHRYPGHDLFNVRLSYALPLPGHSLGLRVSNLLDDDYAERADFAFGEYRYFPGAGRRFFLEWRYVP